MIYEVLANDRRREAIRQLQTAPSGGPVALGDLATAVASSEHGESPPPRPVRESVYSSLHQTHLPKLDGLGVVEYDRERRQVSLRSRARQVGAYMAVITRYGLTWSEYYRTLGTLSLAIVVGALVDLPGIGAVDPLLMATGGLVLFAVSITSQLWSSRWYHRRRLRS
jgi:hypothetical protein